MSLNKMHMHNFNDYILTLIEVQEFNKVIVNIL